MTNGKLAICLVIALASSLGSYTKMAKRYILLSDKHCPSNPQKQSEIQQIAKRVNLIPDDQKMISTGGIVPNLLRPGLKLYQIGVFSRPQPFYQYLLVERDHLQGVHPLTPNQVKRLVESCRSYAQTTFLDNQRFFFIQGEIPHDCIAKALAIR